MMLLTFDQFADIPNKIHLFYDQAFYTLFSRHDATKEGFKRRISTDLSVDVFKEILSLFCLVSYFDFTYEFDDVSVLVIIKKALKIAGQNVSADDFLRDLLDSVCILQRDGLSITFTHRSFQEFFCANALINVVPAQIKQLMPGILVGRNTDSVSLMCIEMNRDLVESQLIIPALYNIVKKIDSYADRDPLFAYLKATGSEIIARRESSRGAMIFFVSSDDELNVIEQIRWVYKDFIKIGDRESPGNISKNYGALSRIIKKNGEKMPRLPAPGESRNIIPFIHIVIDGVGEDPPDPISIEPIVIKADISDLDDTTLRQRAINRIEELRLFQSYFMKKTERRSKTIDEIFFSTDRQSN